MTDNALIERLAYYNDIAARPNTCVLMDHVRGILALANALAMGDSSTSNTERHPGIAPSVKIESPASSMFDKASDWPREPGYYHTPERQPIFGGGSPHNIREHLDKVIPDEIRHTDKYTTLGWQIMACAREFRESDATPKEIGDALMAIVRKHYQNGRETRAASIRAGLQKIDDTIAAMGDASNRKTEVENGESRHKPFTSPAIKECSPANPHPECPLCQMQAAAESKL